MHRYICCSQQAGWGGRPITSSLVVRPSGSATARVRKAAPTVARDAASKVPREKRRARQDLPTPWGGERLFRGRGLWERIAIRS